MAWVIHETVINDASGSGPGVFYLKQFLVATGWSVIASSDGTANWGPGDNLLNDATGAFGVRNNNMWLILEDPGGLRQLAFTSTASTTALRITYSPRAKYTTGGSLTVAPTATDAVEVFGNGSGGQSNFIGNLDAASYFAGVVEDAPVNGVYPFHFWWIRRNSGFSTGGMSSLAMCALIPGTYPSDDTEPLVTYAGVATPDTVVPNLRMFVKFGDPTWETWANGDLWAPRFAATTNYLSSANNYDGTTEMFPVVASSRIPISGVLKNQYKGVVYGLARNLRSGLLFPQVIGEGTPGGWVQGPGDGSASFPGPFLCIPWPNAPRPRL